MTSAVPGGFTLDDFEIDTAAKTVTCPAGHTVKIRESGAVSFVRHCTTAKKGRTIKVHEHLIRAMNLADQRS